MLDSLEDFVRISRHCKEGPTQISKDVLITAQIKQECDAKVMQILQFAIEGKMRSDALFRCLPYINQSHYQDIVEERAISKLCGYPLCSKHILDMPKKQFYISTKNNKVYDITDRKNYCSSFCYRASIHVKDQIDTSPLWLRKHSEKAQFTLLHKSEKGLPGQVVDLGITKPVVEPIFTSVSAFTQMSLDEAEELELNPEEEEKSKKQPKRPKKFQKKTMKTINENEEEEQNENLKEEQIKSDPYDEEIKKTPKDDCQKAKKIYYEEFSQLCKQKDKKKETSFKKPSQPKTILDVESHLYKCFREWFTLETYIFVYGEDKIKKKLDSQKLSDYFDSLKIAELQVDQQKRYMEICRKLHLKELADEKFDQAAMGNNKIRPIPDYHELKQENHELDLKVKSFFDGELHVQEDKNFPVKQITEAQEEDEAPPAVLPMVDSNSQTALRRKIFLNSLNKTVQVLLQTLKLSPSLVLPDLQALVKTFKLKADNIVFKPPMWNCIAIILLKIISLTDENIKDTLESERCTNQLNLWLTPLPHNDKIINDIVDLLNDIDAFVEEFIICK